jgi:hypothetical protein
VKKDIASTFISNKSLQQEQKYNILTAKRVSHGDHCSAQSRVREPEELKGPEGIPPEFIRV